MTMDPERVGEIALLVAGRMGDLDPAHRAKFEENAKTLQSRLASKTKDWQARIVKSGVTKIITFHKTLNYFFDRFNLKNPAILEPKPGIPPTLEHTLEVIEVAKAEKVPLILVENFFDPSVADRVAKDVPGLRVAIVPVSVDGNEKVKTIDDVYETLVQAIEGKK